MSANNELLDKLKQFLTEDEIKEGIEKGVIKVDIEKGEGSAMERMPFTDKSPGLGSGTGPINQTMADSASWEMVRTTIMKAIEGIEKANEMLSSFMEKADYKEDQDKDMEKAYGKMMSSADEMKKNMKMYKAKMNMNKGDMDMNKGLAWKETQGMKDTGMSKAEKEHVDQLEKAFNNKLDGLNSKNETLEKANQDLLGKNESLEKSLTTLTEQFGQLKADMDKIGKETPAPKSVNYQAYIEKGGVKDDDGKKIYHVGMHRSQIINELEKAKAGLDDIEKAQVDDDILQYATAGIAPSEATSRLLYDKHNVKLVK